MKIYGQFLHAGYCKQDTIRISTNVAKRADLVNLISKYRTSRGKDELGFFQLISHG